MLTKILLTLLVIAGAWVVLRVRAKKLELPPVYKPPAVPPPPPIDAEEAPSGMRITAIALLIFMLSGVGWLLYDYWFDARRVVEVQVINSNTGAITSYDARKGDVDLRNGAFNTLSGRRVVLAAIERMEVREK
jgi:hypothetical protein